MSKAVEEDRWGNLEGQLRLLWGAFGCPQWVLFSSDGWLVCELFVLEAHKSCKTTLNW